MAVYDREEDAPQVNLYGRKMKLLEVMRILERETDAEHALTANRIAARLEEKGFPHADRKGIYDDINVLNCFLKPGGGGGCKRPRIEKDEITLAIIWTTGLFRWRTSSSSLMRCCPADFCRRPKQWNWSARWKRSVPCIRPKG